MAEAGEGGKAAVVRVPAAAFERVVVEALIGARLLTDSPGPLEASGQDGTTNAGVLPAERARAILEGVSIRSGEIEIRLNEGVGKTIGHDTIVVPWSKPPTRVQRQVISPAQGQWADPRVMSSDTRSRLLTAIATARCWLDDLILKRDADIDALGRREHRSARSITMLLSLAFLAPEVVKAIIDSRMPRGIGLTDLVNLPIEWGDQWRALGFSN